MCTISIIILFPGLTRTLTASRFLAKIFEPYSPSSARKSFLNPNIRITTTDRSKFRKAAWTFRLVTMHLCFSCITFCIARTTLITLTRERRERVTVRQYREGRSSTYCRGHRPCVRVPALEEYRHPGPPASQLILSLLPATHFIFFRPP